MLPLIKSTESYFMDEQNSRNSMFTVVVGATDRDLI